MNKEQVHNHLTQVGVIAILPGDLPLQSIVQIADALLAAPVLAVEVQQNGRNAHAIVKDLRQRAGTHMVVGMGGLTQAGQVEKAIAVGAQFITSINLDEAIRIQCYQQNILYIPSVISIFAAQAALTTFCPFVRVITGGPQGPGYIRTMCSSLPELGIMVAGDFSLDEVKCYKDAGAIGVIIGTTLVSGPTQPMADIISRARALQQIWGVAEAQEDDKPTN